MCLRKACDAYLTQDVQFATHTFQKFDQDIQPGYCIDAAMSFHSFTLERKTATYTDQEIV